MENETQNKCIEAKVSRNVMKKIKEQTVIHENVNTPELWRVGGASPYNFIVFVRSDRTSHCGLSPEGECVYPATSS